jgi:hypothetical protein
MPYVAPSTVVAGQTYGAAAHNVIVNDVIDHESRIVTATNQSVQVFTNEAARDAAITAPSEGMHAYLTAPTVPAATGGTTYVPTGVLTRYNGSNWVCVTPVGAFTNNGGSTTSTSFTASLTGTPGTNPSVTLVTGTSVLINIRATLSANVASTYVLMGVAVSGASTIGASDGAALYIQVPGLTEFHSGISFMLSGLTAGTNTFTLQYRVNTNTGSFGVRGISVVGIA